MSVSGIFLSGHLTEPSDIVIDRVRKEIRFAARTDHAAFSRARFQPGHHLVVSTSGISRFGALFRTTVSDLDVRRALESLGAEQGGNLLVETWTQREDELSEASDLKVEGTPISVSIEYGDRRWSFSDLVRTTTAEGHAHEAPRFRYGGNEEFRSIFRSGCIVCNYSCPGGAIGNQNATIRDELEESIVFSIRDDSPIPDGATVTVILRIDDEEQ